MDLGRQGARAEGPRLEARRAENGGGVLGEGQLDGLGAPAAKGFSRILNTHDDLSGQQDYGPRRFYFFGFLAEW